MKTENFNCDGSGPHASGTVKLYPLGGHGNAILCFKCWVAENKYNYERGKETGEPENWPQHNWYDAKEYKNN